MAFKLTKAEAKRRTDLVSDLEIASTALATAFEEYNKGLADLRLELAGAVTAYNKKLAEAREFAESIATAAEEDYENKSERWQDSDKGVAAGEWRDEWQNIELESVDAELPDDLEFPDLAHRDDLENLPEGFDES